MTGYPNSVPEPNSSLKKATMTNMIPYPIPFPIPSKNDFMTQSEGFETTHEDAVGNDKSHEHRELFAHLVHIGFENLVYDNYQCGDDD